MKASNDDYIPGQYMGDIGLPWFSRLLIENVLRLCLIKRHTCLTFQHCLSTLSQIAGWYC